MPTSLTYKELQEENKKLKEEIIRLRASETTNSDKMLLPGGSLLYSLIQSLPLNIYAKNPSGKFIFANDFYCENIGITNKEIIGQSDFDVHPPDLAKKYLADDQRIMDSCIVESIEEEWKSIGGESSYVDVIKSPIYEYDNNQRQSKILGTMGIFWDITKRKKAEHALIKSEELYRVILDNIKEGYFELDISYKLKFCNNAFCFITGQTIQQLYGSNLIDLARSEDRRTLKSFFNMVLFQNSSSQTDQFLFIGNSDQPKTLDLSITPKKDEHDNITGVRGIIRDISKLLEAGKQKKLLEKQLLQAQKLESIGTLAGGIAHDFNNILFIIQGYTDLALNDLKKDRNPLEKLVKIKDSCSRAKDLIEQILSFARHSEKQRVPIDIRPIVKESLQLLRLALPATIKITDNISNSYEQYILADPTEINQIIMNLGTNAGHSMTADNGILCVELSNVIIDEKQSNLQPGLGDGNYLQLTISDTGKGIPETDYARIFEPFFTTKKVGEGTGLGLSVVHGIITGMDGRIFVESIEGQGTTFRIYFPVTEKSLTIATEKTRKIPKGTREHILLVDDDKALLNMLTNMLHELNYSCTACSNGSDAFDLFNKQPNQYDLLFTDQTMPGLTGDALSISIKSIRPDIPIILCTGFSERITPEKAAEIGIDIFLSKPILIESLADSLYKLLHTNFQHR